MFQRIRETLILRRATWKPDCSSPDATSTRPSPRRFADIEPATERELAQVASASADDVDRAVDAAREAADRGPWPRMSADARAGILEQDAPTESRNVRAISGMLEARDVGKPVSECVNHDVARAARNLRFFAAVAQTWTHEAAISDAKFLGRDLKLMSVTQRPPVGVGAIIIPWNSPLMLATWNLGPCLAAGNTCVLKPSELAPLTSIALGEIANEAGLPPGVLNIVPDSATRARALVVASGRRRDRVYRRRRDRATRDGVGGRVAQARDARARRQVAEPRIRRRESEAHRRGRRAIDLSQPGTIVRRRLAIAGRQQSRREFLELLVAEIRDTQDRRSARRRHRVRSADFGGASRAGPCVRRRRGRQRRENLAGGKIPTEPATRTSTICRRCSTMSIRNRAPCPRKSSGRC